MNHLADRIIGIVAAIGCAAFVVEFVLRAVL